MISQDIERLRSIKTFRDLVKYLRDELEWPIESEDFDDLTFDYDPEELGIDAKTAVKIKDIKQLRPLSSKQPWGIFFINFEPKQLPLLSCVVYCAHSFSRNAPLPTSPSKRHGSFMICCSFLLTARQTIGKSPLRISANRLTGFSAICRH